jgi:Mrp family chromosome partitioning ATPase/capsular polysaccharide biosynthesis protein
MNQQLNRKTLADRLVDAQPEQFSFRDMISKVFLRPKLFLLALLLPPLVAMFFSSLVPTDWAASTKILIRYSSADNNLLKNLVSDSGLGISGETSAELIKSTPVLEKTIQTVGITEEDIYKKPSRVIMDKLSSIFKFGGSPTNAPNQENIDRTGLINGFKDSLDSTSKKSGNDQSIEILDKKSQMPESMKLDELITLQVKSFNREKVDDMANGLAAAYIDEYYRIYTEESKNKLSYLDALIEKEEAQLKFIERATPQDFASNNATLNVNSGELISRDVPILNSLATQLTGTETELTRMQQVYAPSSPKLKQLRSQVSNLKFMFKKQERIEVSKQLLEQLNTKRYQALNTQNIYKNRLIPISIVESAAEPGAAGGGKFKKVLVSGVIGFVLGFILAIGLTIVLNVLDPRVHFRKDVEKLVSSPILASIPMLKDVNIFDYKTIGNNPHLEQGVWQLITQVGAKAEVNTGKVITMASSATEEGVTFCSLMLALNLAKNKSSKVCLIDANFIDGGLSSILKLEKEAGLIDAIADHTVSMSTVPAIGDVLTVGNLSRRTELGYYSQTAETIIKQLKTQYDYVIIDAGEALKSNEAQVFGQLSDELIMIVGSGIARKGMLETAVNKLQNNQANVTGIVLNQSKQVLPDAVYKMI